MENLLDSDIIRKLRNKVVHIIDKKHLREVRDFLLTKFDKSMIDVDVLELILPTDRSDRYLYFLEKWGIANKYDEDVTLSFDKLKKLIEE